MSYEHTKKPIYLVFAFQTSFSLFSLSFLSLRKSEALCFLRLSLSGSLSRKKAIGRSLDLPTVFSFQKTKAFLFQRGSIMLRSFGEKNIWKDIQKDMWTDVRRKTRRRSIFSLFWKKQRDAFAFLEPKIILPRSSLLENNLFRGERGGKKYFLRKKNKERIKRKTSQLFLREKEVRRESEKRTKRSRKDMLESWGKEIFDFFPPN